MKVVIITTGQPSSNPRLLKEAVSLYNAGYNVTVLYTFWVLWADKFDVEVKKKFPGIKWIRVGGHPLEEKWNYFFTRLLNKLFRVLYNITALKYFQENSISRTSFLLIKRARKIQAQLYIAHYLGALPAAIKAAKKFQAKAGIDFEDYYRGQWNIQSKEYKYYKSVEDKYLSKLNFSIAASPLIAKKYKEDYPFLSPVTINNVFSKECAQNNLAVYKSGDVLKLFWFSQTVGFNRGLETVFKAIGMLGKNISVTILGKCTGNIKDELLKLATDAGVLNRQVNFMEPVAYDKIFSIAAQHHIGLALESDNSINREICLTNKIFTYLLSGLAIIATDTLAQTQFLETHPGAGNYFVKGEAIGLSQLIDYYKNNPNQLQQNRQNALQMALNELNWENEEKKLLRLINNQF